MSETVRALSSEREDFEADAEPLGFDLTRAHNPNVEPWDDYVSQETGHRWGGWQARAERAAVPAASTCEHCQGNGVIFTHAEDCDDDLCALNGDMHSCVGQLIPCECAAVPASHPPAVPVELAGWKLVPIEPTEEMLAAVLPAFNRANSMNDSIGRKREPLSDAEIYKAMLAVSPLASDSVHSSGALRMSGAAAPSGD